MFKYNKKLVLVYLLSFLTCFFISENNVRASALSPTITLSDNTAMAENVEYQIGLNVATSQKMRKVEIHLGKDSGDDSKPANMDLSSVNVNFSGLNSSVWSVDNTNTANGLIILNNSEIEDGGQNSITTITSANNISITISGVGNPELSDCGEASADTGGFSDTCYLFVDTYAWEGELDPLVLTDTGITGFFITDEPYFEVSVEGVGQGVTTTGSIETTDSSTPSLVDFDLLKPLEPRFSAHKITVKSNSFFGYSVNIKTDGYLESIDGRYKIDPFLDWDVTWETPRPWNSPFGTTPSSDTGWIGANTTDNRVPDRDNSAGKFGPLSSTRHAVLYSNTRDRSGTPTYITYGIEINEHQPAGTYNAILVIDAIPSL